jgi:hypothetical protein
MCRINKYILGFLVYKMIIVKSVKVLLFLPHYQLNIAPIQTVVR